MVTYLIWVNVYLTVFYIFYWLCLRRETFFQLNRVYLLSSVGLAFILPLIKWDAIQSFWSTKTPLYFHIAPEISVQSRQASIDPGASVVETLYMAGVVVALSFFIYRLIKLRRHLTNGLEGQAFSFCHWVYIDPKVSNYHWVAAHEQVHICQWHSLDALLFEIVKIINWFNPVVYLYIRAMKLTHEYIADNKTAPVDDRTAYAHVLVSQALGVPVQSLGNHFFNQSFTKNRIVMLFKNKSKKTAYWRLAGILPLGLFLLAFQGEKTLNGDAQIMNVQETLAVKQDTVWKEVDVQPNPPGGI